MRVYVRLWVFVSIPLLAAVKNSIKAQLMCKQQHHKHNWSAELCSMVKQRQSQRKFCLSTRFYNGFVLDLCSTQPVFILTTVLKVGEIQKMSKKTCWCCQTVISLLYISGGWLLEVFESRTDNFFN